MKFFISLPRSIVDRTQFCLTDLGVPESSYEMCNRAYPIQCDRSHMADRAPLRGSIFACLSYFSSFSFPSGLSDSLRESVLALTTVVQACLCPVSLGKLTFAPSVEQADFQSDNDCAELKQCVMLASGRAYARRPLIGRIFKCGIQKHLFYGFIL